MCKTFEEMTYKEFKDYCNERACDGKWGMNEALNCIAIIEAIDDIQVRVMGFYSRKKTQQAREEAWQKIILEIHKASLGDKINE